MARIRWIFRFVAAALLGVVLPAAATPLEECAPSTVPMVCLDAKLKAANQRLNAALKAAQQKIETLQADKRRPVLGAFIDSQRKFNAYRDAQCTWQSIRAAPGQSGLEFVKDCQIRETLLREEVLLAFVAGGGEEVSTTAAVSSSPASVAAESPVPAVAESRAPAQAAVVPESAPQPTAVAEAETPKPQPPANEPPPAEVAPAQPAPGAAAETASPPRAVQEPVAARRGFEWRLSKWVANGAEKTILPESGVSIAFDPSGKVAGQASVNRYSGSFRFDADGRLVWQPPGFAVTRMAGPAAMMAQERAFLDSLRRTVRYRVEGAELVLESANASTILTFTR